MNFVPETGAGLSNATSYADLQPFKDHFTDIGIDVVAAGWTDDRIKAALNYASNYMVALYRDRWQGRRTSQAQTLDWPRYGVIVDRDQGADMWMPGIGAYGIPGFLIPSDQVPTQVIWAAIELAALRGGADGSETNELLPDLAAGASGIQSKTIGPLSTTWFPWRNPVPIYGRVNAMLKPLLTTAANVVSLVRG